MPNPAERVSRLSTSDGYSHPSGPQLQTNQDPEVSCSLWTLWLVFMRAWLLLDTTGCHVSASNERAGELCTSRSAQGM